jgi:hypothetical protein
MNCSQKKWKYFFRTFSAIQKCKILMKQQTAKNPNIYTFGVKKKKKKRDLWGGGGGGEKQSFN